jgi:hypothetical protein
VAEHAPKIALIGAGSVVFAKNLIGDILGFPELSRAHIALMDIDTERLRTAERMTHKVAAALRVEPTITAHADRRAALAGADYVINTIPGRRLSPVDGRRLRSSQAARLAPDDRRHARRRRIHARASARFPCCSTSAATWKPSVPTPGCSTTRTRWR